MFLDTLSFRTTLICLALAVFVTWAYVLRIFYRNDVRYDVVSEWAGHGFHGIGMTYMSLAMLEWVPALVPFVALAVFFAMCTAIFVYRLAFRLYYIWWWDVLHVVGSASAAYMFYDPMSWSPAWTLFFIGYNVLIIGIYVYYMSEHWKIGPSRARFAHLLSDTGHHAMAIMMILMFVMMQWRTEVVALSLVMCGDATSTSVTGHKHTGH